MMDLVNQIVSERNLYYHHNIVPGHTKVKVNWKKTLLLAAFRHVSFNEVRNYLFYFYPVLCGDSPGSVKILRTWRKMIFIAAADFLNRVTKGLWRFPKPFKYFTEAQMCSADSV